MKICTFVLVLIASVTTEGTRAGSHRTRNHRTRSTKPDVSSNRPHIIFVLADDLGFNDVGWHALGGSMIRTPYLDHLAYNGIRLENYYVQPMCSPTRTSLMTGRYVTNLGLQHVNFSPTDGLCLPFDQKILPEKLRDLGYATHAIGKWHLGMSRKACLPTNRGFDSFFGIVTGTADHFSHKRRVKIRKDGQVGGFYGNSFYVNATPSFDYAGKFCTHINTQRAIDIIKSHDKARPLFMYLALEMVHNPATVPNRYKMRYLHIGNRMRRILAGQVFLLNEAVRNITTALKRHGIYRNSIIIFTSDNGGRMFQKSSNWPLRGEKGTLWEGGIRSPGFVHSPLLPTFIRGTVSRQLMHVSDWLPTLVKGVAGGNLSDLPLPVDGYNMWTSITKNRKSPRKVLLHNINPTKPLRDWTGVDEFRWGKVEDLPFNARRQAAIRVGDWKLVTGLQASPVIELPVESTYSLPHDVRNTGWRSAIRLYNIDADPGERYNIASAYPDKVMKLLRKLKQFQKMGRKPIKFRRDSRSNPAYLNGSWSPWLDDK